MILFIPTQSIAFDEITWGDNQTATIRAILEEDPEPLARYKSGISDELQRIVTRLLEKNPDHRCQSATDLIADLKRVREGISRPSGESVVLTASAGKRRFSLLIAILALVIISAVVIIYLVAERKSPRHTVAQRTQLTFYGDVNLPAISPDGEYLFFVSDQRIENAETAGPGNGKGDIYWVDAKIIEDLKPDELTIGE